MSIFGKLDAATIPSNPYFVEKGTYEAEVTNAEIRTNKKDIRQLFLEFTINDATSQYLDSKVAKFFDLPDDNLTEQDLALMDPESLRTIRRTMSAMKRILCGNEGNSSQKGLGVPPEDLNDPDWNPAVLIGIKVMMGVSNYGPSNQGVNLAWVNIITE